MAPRRPEIRDSEHPAAMTGVAADTMATASTRAGAVQRDDADRIQRRQRGGRHGTVTVPLIELLGEIRGLRGQCERGQISVVEYELEVRKVLARI